MFDGIKILDLSVSTDALLQNDRLLFPLPVDEQTGAVLDQPRRGMDRGLKFTLTPRLSGGYRVEMNGSVHRHYRNGVHNADDFTAVDLLAALDQLVTTYEINPFTSRLNNVEFGVNVELPFPVDLVLKNLISYKYRPFTKEPGDGFNYYQCLTQRYAVKLYDKGNQYRNIEPYLSGHVLRVEVKVLRMEYLIRQGTWMDWLTDLLTVENYGPLGALLVETFSEILFDEPTIDTAKLTARERDIYQNGRNPKFWDQGREDLKKFKTLKSIPAQKRKYDAKRQWLCKYEREFRVLLNQHQLGDDWQRLTATLIGQTWARLTTVDNTLQKQIKKRLKAWYNNVESSWEENINRISSTINYPLTCYKLTGLVKISPGKSHKLTSTSGEIISSKCHKLTGFENGKISHINPLSIELICDNAGNDEQPLSATRGTIEIGSNSEAFSTSDVEIFPQNVNRVLAPSEGEEDVQSIQRKGTDNNEWPACEKVCSDSVTGVIHRRNCPMTGLDISHQLPTTRFVTATTLKKLYASNRQVFEQLAEQFLPADRVYFEPESRSFSIAYNIRFLDSQQRYQARRLAGKAQKSKP